MSKHTVTMKSLIDENTQLKMKLHYLEAEFAAYKALRRPKLFYNDYRFTAGMALGWVLSWVINGLLFHW